MCAARHRPLLRPNLALLIDVDVDLYISCMQCMDWMFANGLIVPGTVVYYDDVSIVKADAGGELGTLPVYFAVALNGQNFHEVGGGFRLRRGRDGRERGCV